MKVLMILRQDQNQVSGGDLTQAKMTSNELKHLQVEIDIVDNILATDLSRYDLVHFFHLPAVNHKTLRRLKENNIPVVMSPIFWDTTPLWFNIATTKSPTWKAISRIVGNTIGRELFTLWQHAKRRRWEIWKNQRWILETVDCLLPNAYSEITHIAKYFSIELDALLLKSIIVPNGVAAGCFNNIKQATEEFVSKYKVENFILEVARIERAKGQIDLIQSIKDISMPMVFIGSESPYEPDYTMQFRKVLEQTNNGIFLHELPFSEIIGAYGAASVHVLPSWRETPGLASLEAGAVGCRVVSTNVGTAREYFRDMAWYCRPGNIKSIRNSVVNALEEKPNGDLKNHIFHHFTWQGAAEITHEAYRKVLKAS